VPSPLDPPLGAGDHVAGSQDAPLELVMYGDFQCPDAERAALASEAAAAQDAFWDMHDALYAARGRLGGGAILVAARALELDVDRIAVELEEGAHAARVARDVASGEAAGVQGTPAFFVNGVLHEGAFDTQSLIAALET